MLVHPKKAFLLPSVWPGTEYTWVLIWKKSLLTCFESYQWMYSLFPHRQSKQKMVDTSLIVNINPICQIFGEELNGGVHLFLILDQKYFLGVNLVKKIKIVRLSWNLVPKYGGVHLCYYFLLHTRKTILG